MADGIFLSLAPGTRVLSDVSGRCVVERGERRVDLAEPGAAVIEALREVGRGADEDALTSRILDQDGFETLQQFYAAVARLSAYGLVGHAVWHGGVPVAACIPLSPAFEWPANGLCPERRYILSRFALCRRDRDCLVLESPGSLCRVELCDGRTAGVVGQFATPQRGDAIGRLDAGVPQRVLERTAVLLLNSGFLVTQPEGEPGEDAEPALAQWEFHDLFFHSRSRAGRHANPYGAAYRFRERAGDVPAVKLPMSDDQVELYRPDVDALKDTDKPFTFVRDEAIGPESRGASSYRPTARRVSLPHRASKGLRRDRRLADDVSPVSERRIGVRTRCLSRRRPLQRPRVGALPVCPDVHRLCRLAGRSPEVVALLAAAARTAQSAPPHVLLVVTARFPRVSWKYASTAYALVLKDVGVLYQTMYLVATSMGLAGCALGGGNSDRFAAASHLDYFAEGAVGEFIVGLP